MPPMKFRTTVPLVWPIVTVAPSGGCTSVARAAPDSEMSMSLTGCVLPSESRNEPEPGFARRRGEAAEHARMRLAVMAQRQQQKLHVHGAPALGSCRNSGDHRVRAIENAQDQRHDVTPLFLGPKLEERTAFLLGQPERVEPRPGEADRKHAVRVDFEEERISKDVADRRRIDLGPLRRGSAFAQPVPIGE